ncbi:ABC transporter permease [Mediterraneibacter glycyrrhizinilyticus]|uniref:ABC transporter permease n=2 Tax=Mediterraneibacter glycyrrhizinilyticus TaxID=342942 RepID=UPI0025AA4FC3|nr:ABC transporter permease [Mediterraneibacter glycyrrhizinilyticus]MDN0044899.1 FtsX-like permease family protein [Mediterraneibacter glycyrrhizinilyticus]
MSGKKTAKHMIALMSRQSLKTGRMRNIFVSITIVLAAALLTAILMFVQGQRTETARELSHVQQVGYYNLTDDQVQALASDERIAYQIRVKTGVLSDMDGFSAMPYYVSEMSDEIRIGELTEGTLPEKENEAAVQGAMLERMGIEPKVGSSVTLDFYDGTEETFTVSGILAGGEEAKQFSVFFSEEYAENGSQLKDMPYEVYAKIYGAADMYPDELREVMYLIASDAGIEREYVNPSKAYLDSLTIDSQQILLCVLVGGVILLACVLVIYGVFYLSVIGRIHQFGQLRTIGMTKKQLKKFVSREGRLLFLRSVLIGIVIGGVAGYFMKPRGFSILNTLIIAAAVFVIIYIITMLSVHKPAKIAGNVSPMEALRYVPQDGMKQTSGRKQCRDLTPAGLGIMNFSRNRKKAAITMLSLGLGGILFMTAATYMSSFSKESYARQGDFQESEFIISYSPSAVELNENGLSGMQAGSPLGDEMIGEIASIDGVEQITERKGFGVQYDFPQHNNDIIYPLTEEELQGIGSYLEEGTADMEALLSGNQVLVAENDIVEEIYGWRFQVGDTVTLRYYDGSGMREKEVEIAGMLNGAFNRDHNGIEGWFVMPEQTLLDWISYDSINSSLLISTDPAKETKVGESLEQIVGDRSELTMETLAERRIAYEQSADQIFGAISGLAIFIMMFSILSMMNTLITNIVTRKQELAMLESIGMSKGQIRKMLLGESLLLVGVTVGVTMTIGTLCGYILCRMLRGIGAVYMQFRFPFEFALGYVVVLILVPLLITIVSMKSFAREALVERLRGMEC